MVNKALLEAPDTLEILAIREVLVQPVQLVLQVELGQLGVLVSLAQEVSKDLQVILEDRH